MDERPAESFTDDYLLYLLAHASAAASAAFHAELARQGMRVPVWRILASLYPDARLQVGALARKCLMKQPTLTRTIDRLESQGLLRRSLDSDDRRAVRVALTAAGRRLAAEKVALARRHEAAVLAGHDAGEVAALKKQLRALIDAVPAWGGR